MSSLRLSSLFPAVLFAALLPAHGQQVTTSMALGIQHSCALSAAGGVKCWGVNANGQLGDGTTVGSAQLVDVVGLQSGVVAIAVGVTHSCALTTAGGVKCWGGNPSGQLGNGNTTRQLTPVDVSGLTSGVAVLASGQFHTCAIMASGAGLKCWGGNAFGQLGDGTTAQRTVPTDVIGLTSGVAMVAPGGIHTCAVMVAGGVKCWGINDSGQLGNNDPAVTSSATPVDVVGLSTGITAITTGESHICVVIAGAAKCWGYNGLGELGDGTTTSRYLPTDITALGSNVAAIAPGGDHTCALLTDGSVKCWGLNNGGQVGDGTTTTRLLPTPVAGLLGPMAAIYTGPNADHSCAITPGGGVKCWGFTGSTPPNPHTPTYIPGLVSGVMVMAPGESHACALLGGGVKCWGANLTGQLGAGPGPARALPADVPGLAGAIGLASGYGHSCALTSAGGVKCWGANSHGQVGDGTTTNRFTPTDVTGLSSGVAMLALGGGHTCAILSAGGAKCWGWNDSGQLGNNDPSIAFSAVPVDVSGLSGPIDAISSGESHVCVIISGAVKCWGYNGLGELGDGTTTTRYSPVDIAALGSGVLAIRPGGDHTCALMSGGTVKCWGRGTEGQVGDGALTTRLLPVDVPGVSGISAITVGSDHSCALAATGTIKCWGGVTGDGTALVRASPVDVVGVSGIEGIAAGFSTTFAITANRAVKAWGTNANGQIGDGTTVLRLTAVDTQVGPQSIAFAPPASGFRRDTIDLAATASSGLAVTFDTWTAATCEVIGTQLHFLDDGLCGVRASQLGDGRYLAAPQQLDLIVVYHDRRRRKP